MIMRHEGKSISSQHHIRILFIGPTFLKLFLPSLTCGEQDSRCAEGKRALEHFNLLAHNDNIHSPSLPRSLPLRHAPRLSRVAHLLLTPFEKRFVRPRRSAIAHTQQIPLFLPLSRGRPRGRNRSLPNLWHPFTLPTQRGQMRADAADGYEFTGRRRECADSNRASHCFSSASATATDLNPLWCRIQIDLRLPHGSRPFSTINPLPPPLLRA